MTTDADGRPTPLRPNLLFVCVKNGGKSQLAASLARQRLGERADVHSAGTDPGTSLNAEAVASLAEVGADVEGEFPKRLTDDMLRSATHVVVIGSEARVAPVPGMAASIDVWETDEPSLRGIEGPERMRLIRDEIAGRIDELAAELDAAVAE